MSFNDLYRATSTLGQPFFDEMERNRLRDASKQVGQQIGAGDYGGAARTAFEIGDTQTGIALTKLGQAYTKDAREQAAQAEIARGFGSFFGGGEGGGSGALAPLGAATGGGQGSRLPSFAMTSGPSGDYIANLFRRESGNNPTAQASTSSARGLGQFTTGTWNGLARSRPDLSLTPVAGGQDGRTDPEQMLRATRAFTDQNEDILRRSNLPVNDATRYSLHFLGSAGGPRFVAGTLSNPDKPAASYVSPEQVAANRRVFFNRDGTAKTAGQVMADFSRSFGGGSGGAPAVAPPQRVAYADDEAQVQALEARMGMVPQAPRQAVRQMASADPQADMPVPNAQEARFEIPPAPASPFPPSVNSNGRLSPAVPPSAGSSAALALGGSAEGGRVMSMPGDAPPVQVAQAGGQGFVSDAQVGGAPVQSVMARPTTERLRFLGSVLASSNATAGQRELASTLFKQTLDETRMPDSVKEYVWARANGMTQAASPAAYAREKAGPTTLAPGTTVYDPQTRSAAYTAPTRAERDKGDDLTDQTEARRRLAPSLGLEEGTPAWRSYVGGGKIGADRDMSAGDKKAVDTAVSTAQAARSSIGLLEQAKGLSAKAYAGPWAGQLATITSLAGNEAGLATKELDNIVTVNALNQLKAIFGGAPTEGERKILLDVQGSSSQPHAVRVRIYDRAIEAMRLREQQNADRAEAIINGTAYRPRGGQQQGGDRRALPAPTSANRPGAASAKDRFGQLVGSGMTKQQAFERMQDEGY